MIKQRIMLTEILEVKFIGYMKSHNSGNIHGENLHIWSNEKIISQKLKYIFTKNYNKIMRTYWATNYESKSESKFWVTCRCMSDSC